MKKSGIKVHATDRGYFLSLDDKFIRFNSGSNSVIALLQSNLGGVTYGATEFCSLKGLVDFWRSYKHEILKSLENVFISSNGGFFPVGKWEHEFKGDNLYYSVTDVYSEGVLKKSISMYDLETISCPVIFLSNEISKEFLKMTILDGKIVRICEHHDSDLAVTYLKRYELTL